MISNAGPSLLGAKPTAAVLLSQNKVPAAHMAPMECSLQPPSFTKLRGRRVHAIGPAGWQVALSTIWSPHQNKDQKIADELQKHKIKKEFQSSGKTHLLPDEAKPVWGRVGSHSPQKDTPLRKTPRGGTSQPSTMTLPRPTREIYFATYYCTGCLGTNSMLLLQSAWPIHLAPAS